MLNLMHLFKKRYQAFILVSLCGTLKVNFMPNNSYKIKCKNIVLSQKQSANDQMTHNVQMTISIMLKPWLSRPQ